MTCWKSVMQYYSLMFIVAVADRKYKQQKKVLKIIQVAENVFKFV